MNNQDVIKICNAILECIEKDNVVMPVKKSDGNEIIEGMKVAISALEKQIPKKIVGIKDKRDFKGNIIYKIGYCPDCGTEMVTPYGFCRGCGCKLNWSVEE